MNSATWSDESFFTRKFLASNVDYESVRGVKAAVAAGVPLKELMRADDQTRGRVEALALGVQRWMPSWGLSLVDLDERRWPRDDHRSSTVHGGGPNTAEDQRCRGMHLNFNLGRLRK